MSKGIFEKYKHLHFIGAGGIGMSALAQICCKIGITVTGSDICENDITIKLEQMGIKIFLEHNASNLGKSEAVVYSSAIKNDNPEFMKAKENNLPIFHRSEILEEIISEYKSIAVSGTHGKTTVSAMIACVLNDGGIDPTALIGGYVKEFDGNARIGDGEWLVAEADESDGSFLNLSPDIIVITNIELDHVDFYKDASQVEKAFTKFLHENLKDGHAVLYRDDPRVFEIAKNCNKKIIWYGTHDEAYIGLKKYIPGTETSKAVITKGGNIWGELNLKVPGKTNALNALAALAVGDLLGLDYEVMAETLGNFTGVKRRQEVKGKVKDILFLDDYGHHSTEIRLTLEALREKYPGRQVVIFQPHRYSRTLQMAKDFADALKSSDLVVIMDVYSAGEKLIEGVSGKNIMNFGEKDWMYLPKEKDVLNELPPLLKPGDIVITMGAGDVYKYGEKILEILGE